MTTSSARSPETLLYENIHFLSDAEKKSLLDYCRALVPREWVENGHERSERYRLPKELQNPSLRRAATILALGELEMIVEAPSLSSTGIWRETLAALHSQLGKLSRTEEKTEGDPTLSRAAHVYRAKKHLQDLEAFHQFYRAQMDAKEQDWFDEVFGQLMTNALFLGIEYRAAEGKDTERLAAIREKQSKGFGSNPAAIEHRQSRRSQSEEFAALAKAIADKSNGRHGSLTALSKWVAAQLLELHEISVAPKTVAGYLRPHRKKLPGLVGARAK